MEMSVTRPAGSITLPFAIEQADRAPAPDDRRHLDNVIARLEACQAELRSPRDAETAGLIAIALLQLRMRMQDVSADELKLLSDQLASREAN
jgi:hypothetical protein